MQIHLRLVHSYKKYLGFLKAGWCVKRVEICFDNIIHNTGFAQLELITLHLQMEESWHGISS